MDMKKEVFAFAGIVFLLLGVLFGMQIMTFIFGNVGTVADSLDPASIRIVNETGGFVNDTGYTLAGASVTGFSGVSITQATNGTLQTEIELGAANAGNYTVNITTGIVRNSTATTWSNVSFTYTYNFDSAAKVTSDAVTNNSLTSIETYTEQSDTQFNTTAIAITLLILIALFVIFWRIFMAKGGIGGGGSGSDKNFS